MTGRCTHPLCDEPGTDVRGAFLFCFGHWLVLLMQDQPAVFEDAS